MKKLFVLILLSFINLNAQEYYWKYINKFDPWYSNNLAVLDENNIVVASLNEYFNTQPEFEFNRYFSLLKSYDQGKSFDTIFSFDKILTRDGFNELEYTYSINNLKYLEEDNILFVLNKYNSRTDSVFNTLYQTKNGGLSWDTVLTDCYRVWCKDKHYIAVSLMPSNDFTYEYIGETNFATRLLLSNNNMQSFDTLLLNLQEFIGAQKIYIPQIEYFNSDTLILNMWDGTYELPPILLHSYDRGKTWTKVPALEGYTNIKYNFYDSKLVIGYGQKGKRDMNTPYGILFPSAAYISTDGGHQWVNIINSADSLFSYLTIHNFLSRNEMLISNTVSIYRSIDMGVTWEQDSIHTIDGLQRTINTWDFGADGSAYFSFSSGHIHKQEKMLVSSINFDLKPEERFSYLVENKFIIPNFVSSISDFSLFTLSGSEVNANFDSSSGTLDLSNLPSGVFVFRLHYTDETKSYILNKK